MNTEIEKTDKKTWDSLKGSKKEKYTLNILAKKGIEFPKNKGEFFDNVKESFRIAHTTWEDQPIENRVGDFEVTLCEKIEKASAGNMISMPIYHGDIDGGYLHVFGWIEKEE